MKAMSTISDVNESINAGLGNFLNFNLLFYILLKYYDGQCPFKILELYHRPI